MASADEALIARLTRSLDDARSAIAAEMVAMGQSFRVKQIKRTLDNTSGTWQFGQVEVEMNALKAHVWLGHTKALAPWLEQASVLARDLGRHFGNVLPEWGAVSRGRNLIDTLPEDLDDRTSQIFVHALLDPVAWFIASVESVGSQDLALATRMAREIVDLLGSGLYTTRQRIVIGGLITEAERLQCGSTAVRTLSAFEKAEFDEMQSHMPVGMGSLARFDFPLLPTHLLEVLGTTRRPNQIGLLPAPRILTALRLHQIDFAGSGVVGTDILPEWAFGGVVTTPFPMRPFVPEPRVLTQSMFEEVCHTADRLEEYSLEAPQKPSDLALHRFNLGNGRSDPADSLVDFVVALEALLLPFDVATRSGDLSYRFRVHGALFIAETVAARRETFRTLREAYTIRSRLVHGGDFPARAEILAWGAKAQKLTAQGLLRAVLEEFPDAAVFNRLVLGEVQPES